MILFQIFYGAFLWALGALAAVGVALAAIVVPIRFWRNRK